jgi:hypothetical protein
MAWILLAEYNQRMVERDHAESDWDEEIAHRVSELDCGIARTVSWEEVQQRICARLTRLPDTLLRFFDKEDYARSFLGGKIRFGLLDHYRAIEGSRRDDTEGRESFEWNRKAPQVFIANGEVVGRGVSDQNIQYSGSSLNPYFILSASHPQSDLQALARKFGRYIVRIDNPQELLRRVKDFWRNHTWALEDSACIGPVVYNKGKLLGADPYLIAPPHYSYSQKPAAFEAEKEFRFVLVCTVESREIVQDYLTLEVGDCNDILTLESQAILH